MGKLELQRTLNLLIEVRNASDWKGKFTQDIRNATVVFRKEHIAEPLEVAIQSLQKELDSRNKVRKYRKHTRQAYRSPYIED